LAGTNIRTLVVDPVTPATVYVATYGSGVQKSTDGGATWTSVNNGALPPGTAYVNGLAIDPIDPQTLYVSAGGVYKTTNGGQSWSALDTGLTNISILGLGVDSVTPGLIYAGTSGSGVFAMEQVPVCGNGVLEAGEQCDDGDTVGGDCCSPSCSFEPVGS